MKQKKLLAGCGAVLALTLGSTALAAGARPSASTVTVRVEGLHRTLINVAGAQVTGEGVQATTNHRGVATITPTRRGNLLLHASKAGHVRGFARVIVS